jgi:uncharacterized protein
LSADFFKTRDCAVIMMRPTLTTLENGMLSIPSYLEIGSGAPRQTAAFFASVFGWPYQAMGEDGGWFQGPTVKTGLHGGDPNPQIYVYFAVADLAQAVERVRAAGGTADAIGPVEPGFGRFCNCKDPTGIAFGLHEPPR